MGSKNGQHDVAQPESPGVNVIPHFERRLGMLEADIVQRDVQIEMMGHEIERLRARVAELEGTRIST